MIPFKPLEEDKASAYILHQLSKTRYACSSLSSPLSSRPGNSVYRGILARPIEETASAKSIIVKHSTDSASKTFEEILLKSLAGRSLSASANVRPPLVYLYDAKSSIQIQEDFSDTDGLRPLMFSANAHELIPSPTTVGHYLGDWLRTFHKWALEPEQVTLRAQMWLNDGMRKTKYDFTYNTVLDVFGNYPELMLGREETLKNFTKFITAELERPSSAAGDGYGLLHADFWSGKYVSNPVLPSKHKAFLTNLCDSSILIPSAGWKHAGEIFIIDWEFAQYGHRSCDLGQLIGDLYERKVYSNLDTAICMSVMEGVIHGYGSLDNDMAFRTAIYVGVHLISWYNRRPRKGPRVASPEVIVAGLTIGRDFIVKGWEKDRTFFQGTLLSSLFPSD